MFLLLKPVESALKNQSHQSWPVVSLEGSLESIAVACEWQRWHRPIFTEIELYRYTTSVYIKEHAHRNKGETRYIVYLLDRLTAFFLAVSPNSNNIGPFNKFAKSLLFHFAPKSNSSNDTNSSLVCVIGHLFVPVHRRIQSYRVQKKNEPIAKKKLLPFQKNKKTKQILYDFVDIREHDLNMTRWKQVRNTPQPQLFEGDRLPAF